MKKLLCTLLAFSLLLTLTACGSSNGYNFDETDMELIQFNTPSADAPAAKLSTSMGDIYVVFFEDDAPVACENFLTLAEDGWYDGTEFFRIEPKTACIAGSQTTDGESPTTIYDGKQFENEYSMNLWPFSGSVCTISNKEGMSDSRFFIIGDVPNTEEFATEMANHGFPEAVREKFDEVGGVPPFTQRYTVFAQVVKGMDVVNAINALAVNDDQYPESSPVTIESVTVMTYADIPAED